MGGGGGRWVGDGPKCEWNMSMGHVGATRPGRKQRQPDFASDTLSLFLSLSLSLCRSLALCTAWSIVKINQSVLCCFWNFCLLFCYFVADVDVRKRQPKGCKWCKWCKCCNWLPAAPACGGINQLLVGRIYERITTHTHTYIIDTDTHTHIAQAHKNA